jgi:hypothetical protein
MPHEALFRKSSGREGVTHSFTEIRVTQMTRFAHTTGFDQSGGHSITLFQILNIFPGALYDTGEFMTEIRIYLLSSPE